MNRLTQSCFFCTWLWTSLAHTSTENFQTEKHLSQNCEVSQIDGRQKTCSCNIVNNQQKLPTGVVVVQNVNGYEVDCFYNITFSELQQIISRCEFKSKSKLKRLKLVQCPIFDIPFINLYQALNITVPLDLRLNDLTISVDNRLKPHLFENLTSINELHVTNIYFDNLTSSIFQKMPNIEFLLLSNNSISFLPNEPYQETFKLYDFNNNTISLVDEFRFPSGLRKLQFSYNNLRYISKNIFHNLTNLRHLYVHDNSIERLSDGIFDNLTSLVLLDLSNNKLTRLFSNLFSHNHMLYTVLMMKACDKELVMLPSGLFANLTFLQYANMSGNYFTNLPNNLFENCIKLKNVALDNNFLKTLPDSIFQHTVNLEELNLNNNELEFPNDTIVFHDLRKLVKLQLRNAFNKNTSTLPPALFSGMTSLIELHLNENNFTDLSDSLFLNCSKLEILDLGDNQLEFLNNRAFYPLRKLEKLYLARNRLELITDEAFHTLESLRELDLSSNKLKIFGEGTIYPLRNLAVIDLSHNQLLLKQLERKDRLHTILKSFMQCERLETIAMRNNSLEYLDAYWMYNLPPNLKLLDLSFNKFFNISLREVNTAQATHRYSPITLDLSDNDIEALPVHEFRDVVKENDLLLNLQKCIKSWKFDSSTISLQLTNNHIACDCNALNLVNYVQKKQYCLTNLKLEGIRCYHPDWLRNTLLEEIDILNLKCPLNSTHPKQNKNCPNGCNCEYRSADNHIIVNCTGTGMQTFPLQVLNISGFTLELYFSRNKFTSLSGLSNLPSVHNVAKLILSFNQWGCCTFP